jgi:hypothetical protein
MPTDLIHRIGMQRLRKRFIAPPSDSKEFWTNFFGARKVGA